MTIKKSRVFSLFEFYRGSEVTSMIEDVGDEMYMVLIISVKNIHHLFKWASGTIIPKMSSTSKFSHQHPDIVANFKSPTSLSRNKKLADISQGIVKQNIFSVESPGVCFSENYITLRISICCNDNYFPLLEMRS